MPTAHIPTYNYCGPGTWDFTKKPKNALDRACRAHDLSYNKSYYSSGKKVSPYFYYTASDEILRREASRISSLPAKFVATIFTIKKNIAKRATSRNGNSYNRRNYRR